MNIIEQLPAAVEELDLSFNPELGLLVYEKIASILDDSLVLKNLKSLQFESSRMDNEMFEIICSGFNYNTKMRLLNVCNNNLTEQAGFLMKNMLTQNNFI